MMNCLYDMVDRRKKFSLTFIPDHCQGSSPSWISGTLQTVFEHARNLSSGLLESSCDSVSSDSLSWTPALLQGPMKSVLSVCSFLHLSARNFFSRNLFISFKRTAKCTGSRTVIGKQVCSNTSNHWILLVLRERAVFRRQSSYQNLTGCWISS